LLEAARLQLTNSVHTALPTFAMSTFLLHVTVREQVDKYRKNFLWRGSDENSRINAKADWPLVAKPKSEEFGVLDLKT
jgi:hypothetical protein